MKAKILLKISFLTGAIPFLGGWGIFFTWLIGRYSNASDFYRLEMVGFMWMIICFYVAIGGLILLLLYVILNRRNLHKSMLITLLVILINIPSVAIVLDWQKSVAGMFFLKIRNETGIQDLHCSVLMNNELIVTQTIDNHDAEVLYLKHYYDFITFEPYQNNQGLTLTFNAEGKEKTIPFSSLPYGNCKQIVIHRDFTITKEN
ncbi:MAG: hypothetical protein N4A35_15795 [Flavobacteriales bacterium]|jgi:hypothetical protein|nr:hypothetical protein [Flavobacteriales bacterium]